MLRSYSFDRMLYLGVSDTHDAQLRILQALTRKFRLAPECNLAAVAELCPFNYTGADFYALCSDAMLKAMSRKAEAVEEKIRAFDPTFLAVDRRPMNVQTSLIRDRRTRLAKRPS